MKKKKVSFAELNKELKSAPPIKEQQQTVAIEANLPRGERAAFLKISITLPAQMLSALRVIGMQMKEAGEKDSDTSSLIRQAVAEFLNKGK